MQSATFSSLILFLGCSALAMLGACEADDNVPPSCVDTASRAANAELACLAVYEPVCGCDGLSYGNACEADRAGVLSYTPGACR